MLGSEVAMVQREDLPPEFLPHPQGDLPSPTDSRFFSRLLSSDDLGDVLDVDEYLRPDKELEEQHCRRQLQLARHTVSHCSRLWPRPYGPRPLLIFILTLVSCRTGAQSERIAWLCVTSLTPPTTTSWSGRPTAMVHTGSTGNNGSTLTCTFNDTNTARKDMPE